VSEPNPEGGRILPVSFPIWGFSIANLYNPGQYLEPRHKRFLNLHQHLLSVFLWSSVTLLQRLYQVILFASQGIFVLELLASRQQLVRQDMDPVSLTASFVAMVQIADSIMSICKGYITSVKDAPRDLRAIMIEVGSVKSVLEVFESLIEGHGHDVSSILQKLKGSSGPLEGCREALAALESLFPTAAQSKPTNSKRKKILLSLENLAWPFKESRARKTLEDLGRYKSAISLALTTESV
jgi:hypothetical protein